MERADTYIVLEGYFESDVGHSHLGMIAEGTRSLEIFYFDRWYNYFIFYEPGGEFRNFYVNIALPPKISSSAVDYVDLDIDIIVWKDGKVVVLDEEEFGANAAIYGYPPEVVTRAQGLKDQIARAPEGFITLFR